jgi:hypothetical protein
MEYNHNIVGAKNSLLQRIKVKDSNYNKEK